MKHKFIIPERIPGLNSSDGLMREHYRAAAVRKDRYVQYIASQRRPGACPLLPGMVRVTYIGYRIILMDWDNHCASFKHIGDALVACGIITDDNPRIIGEFRPLQIKVASKKEERAEIIVEEIK
jgi:hypothetical protein